MKYKINSKKEYHQTMVEVYELMNKGESKLSKDELNKLSVMSEAAEKYEDDVLQLKPQRQPQSIQEMVELKMFEQKITQSKLAEYLGLSKSKVSEILTGKRKPDVNFLKGIYEKLNIDADFLLRHA
ncbi:MAG: type II toxin-antitoxin system HigA family antitoxin [Chitinophagia bacterium]|jgi:HTH-type transcriptional regulator/antitoxin HigA